jgi:hypothetical protein
VSGTREYVFSAAVLYPISLTPRFSEVHRPVYYPNPESFRGLLVRKQKAAEAVWLRRVINTQLKQVLMKGSVDGQRM